MSFWVVSSHFEWKNSAVSFGPLCIMLCILGKCDTISGILVTGS